MSKYLFAFAGLLFFAIGGVLVVISVRRGTRISEDLARRHPQFFAAMGHPRPGYWHSISRSRFDQFILQRKYTELDDPEMVARCHHLRRINLRILYFILSGLALFGAAALWYEWRG